MTDRNDRTPTGQSTLHSSHPRRLAFTLGNRARARGKANWIKKAGARRKGARGGGGGAGICVPPRSASFREEKLGGSAPRGSMIPRARLHLQRQPPSYRFRFRRRAAARKPRALPRVFSPGPFPPPARALMPGCCAIGMSVSSDLQLRGLLPVLLGGGDRDGVVV